ncbi:MAG: hypothetical protein DWH91_02945 [Planctomycetota bacterium]|nr:MAG: hypothetical protein DWH91_02945 [Planctomycetota bacterium]
MNCRNCAAPLTQSVGPLRMICTFCHTIQAATDMAHTVDRVLIFGEAEGVSCPACSTEMVSAQVDDIRACYCQGCRGLLLSSPEFRQVVETRRAQYRGAELPARPAHSTEFSRQLTCPSCHDRMEVHPYYGAGRAIIDSCAPCALVWVDCGELANLEQTPGRRTPPVLETLNLVADQQQENLIESETASESPLRRLMRMAFTIRESASERT